VSDDTPRVYLSPAEYIDSDHPDVRAFAERVTAGAGTARDKARALYQEVRDLYYDPYVDTSKPETFRASSVLAAGRGYCVGKASLYAASCRAVGVPARVAFADVTNHLSTPQLKERMGTDLFAWHGFTEVFLDGQWIKVSPTFNATLCHKLGVAPLDFDGLTDALLQPFDGEGRTFMRYERQHGAFHDVPAKFLRDEMRRLYPRPLSRDDGAPKGDMEVEAEGLRAAG
jgi:transglutaminase-like putative cysteine protease